jgi:hypothetical protein
VSFGHWAPSPHSQLRTAADSLLQEGVIGVGVRAAVFGDPLCWRLADGLATVARTNAEMRRSIVTACDDTPPGMRMPYRDCLTENASPAMVIRPLRFFGLPE